MKYKIFLLILFTFGAFLCSVEQVLAEENSHKIYPMPPSRIADYIDFTKGNKRVLAIYASWCPYCRKQMPDLIKMERKKKGSVIAVSEDQNYLALSKYIKTLDDIPYKVLLSNPGSGKSLPKALSQYGIRQWKGYPTFILLDENNNVIRQGTFSSSHIARFLFSE